MTPKAKEYEDAGYNVMEREREQNGVAGIPGYFVYYISSGRHEPFFLAEWAGFYAIGEFSREEAVNSLYQKIITSGK